jgi:hypothetical protein
MADIANSINNTNLASSADNSNGFHAFDATISNNADASNGPNNTDGAGNVANQQSRERRAAFTLAITECVLGVVEWGVGVGRRDRRVKRVGAKAIRKGVGSAHTIMKREDIAEGMIERQLHRVVKLVVLLQEQGVWRSAWDKIKHCLFRFWVLWVLLWMLVVLVVLRWFVWVERVAQE